MREPEVPRSQRAASSHLLRYIALSLILCGLALAGCAIPFNTASPLHIAAQRGDIETVREWIADGKDVNERYGDYTLILGYHEGSQVRNKTALMFAAEFGHLDIATLLVDAGADLYVVQSNDRGDDRGNAFDIALDTGHGDIARFLWQRSDRKTFARNLPLSFVVAFDRSCYEFPRQGRGELVQFFLTTFDKKYASEALWRISDRLACLPEIRFILDHGIQPAPRALATAASQGLEPIMALYLQRGASVNGRSFTTLHSDVTPLIVAAGAKQLAAMRLLLEKGADPNLQDRDGRTALIAIVSESACSQIDPGCEAQIDGIRLLLRAGARTEIKDRQGKTALDYVGLYGSDPYAERKRALLR